MNYSEKEFDADYEKICDFENLYKAHKKARLGKRQVTECIDFEMNLGEQLASLSENLKNYTYRMQPYYSFMVHDPKDRLIHALHYRDRVVQHALCDEVLAPLIDKKLIYDNAACRLNKGTHFAIRRLTGFLQEYYRKYGADGYILKCDIRKYFNNIDHEILWEKLDRAVSDPGVMWLLEQIIDSYEASPGKGLPLGNQTSQWFALYYLDPLDRLIKEKLRIRYYSRYMDDCVLVHSDRNYLKYCLSEMQKMIGNLGLEFNEKTQVFPLKNGVDYLGYHFYLTESGKVIRKLRRSTKVKYKRKLKQMKALYTDNRMDFEKIHQVVASYHGHMSHGHTWKLENKALREFVLTKNKTR